MKQIQWRVVLLAGLVFAIAFALYCPSLSFSLVNFDDQEFITHNPVIFNGFSWGGLGSAFTRLHGDQTMYVPLLWVSYLLDVKILGATAATPGGFHFTNVLLHALNSALLFLLLFAFCKKPWRAFFFAALWALHPLRVESVAWVTERKDVLSGFFALLCIGAYAWACRHSRPPRASGSSDPVSPFRLSPPFYAASFVFFICGLLVKPMLVTIPFLLLLLDGWPLRRCEPTRAAVLRAAPRLLLEKWLFFLCAAGAAIAVYLTQTKAISTVPLWARLYAIPTNYLFYLHKFFLPLRLYAMVPPYPIPIVSFLMAVGILLAVSAGLWMRRREHPNELVGWLAFLGLLFPVVGIVIIGIYPVADRYSYLPSIGLSIALLFLLPSKAGPSARIFRAGRAGFAVAILGVLAGLTTRLLPTWENDKSLYGHVARQCPGHYAAIHYQARDAFFTKGDFTEADRLADRLLESQPCVSFGLIMKILCLSQLQSTEAAWKFARTNYPPCDNLGTPGIYENHLASLAFLARHYDQAAHYMQETFRLCEYEPKTQEQLHALAMLLAHEQSDEATSLAHAAQIASLRHKSTLAPEDFLISYTTLWRSGFYVQTLPRFQQLVQTYSNRPDILNNIAWLLATTAGSPAAPDEIVQIARQAFSGAPGHPLILDTLSVAQANAGDFDAALQTALQAARLLATATDPNAPGLLRNVEKRIALYREHKPFREDSSGRLLYAP